MKLFSMFFLILLFSTAIFSEPGNSCILPLSIATKIVTIESEQTSRPFAPTAPPEIDGAEVSTEWKTIPVFSTAAVLSLFSAYSLTQVAQGPRTLLEFQILTDHNTSASWQQSLLWVSSPTQLSIGSSELHNHLGTVIGNWAILAGGTVLWGTAAVKFGPHAVYFPEGLTWPVLFLTSSTVSSATTLLQEGKLTEQLVGGCSITAQAIGVGVMAVFLHPKNLKTELLMSMATGVLKSYYDTGSNHQNVLAGSAAISTAYVLAMAIPRAHQPAIDRVFYTGLAGIQALAMTTQAIGDQENTQRVAEIMIMATQWALTLKSLFDFGTRLRTFYIGRFSNSIAQTTSSERLINDPT